MSSFCVQRSSEHPEEQDERAGESFQGTVNIKTTILESTTGMYRHMGVFRFNSHVFVQRYSVHMSEASFLVAGTMPPKKRTTRKFPRAPKLQEPEAGEGSSPTVARQLEFAPKPVLVIKTITKKAFVQPLAFGDTEANIRTKTIFPCWEELFKKIKREETLEYAPHNDPDTRKLDDEVLRNVRKAYLHMVASRTPVFPCFELLKWLIDHTDTQRCLINDHNGECVRVFLPVEVRSYYKLREPEECLSTEFVLSFYQKHNTNKIMAFWWREDKKFTNRTSSWYPMTNLREPYIYLMALLCRLHGEKDCTRFSEAWMPLAYIVAISGIGFNSGVIISKQLSTCIR
jgi:hypothetical protein